MHKIRCGEIWGGVTGQAVQCESSGIRASLFSQPCDGGKGGDVYYFSVCQSDLLTRIVIADVMGHGEKVSKTSEWLYGSIESNMNDNDGAKVLSEVNKEAVEFGFEAMSTGTIAAYYRETGRFYFAYAGHHPVIVYRKSEKRWLELDNSTLEGVDPSGLALAIDEDAQYEQASIPVEPGDQVLIYTDGLIEAINSEGVEFDRKILLSTLNGISNPTPDTVRETAIEALKQHTANDLSHDDITLIVCEILP